MKKIYTINDEFINSRLDRWFRRNLLDVPQSLIEKNIRKGNIRVNKKKNKSSYRLKKNDQIFIKNINFKPKFKTKIKNRYRPSKKEISYSSSIFIENNENFAVINKPSGISVQSGTKSKRNILDILRVVNYILGNLDFTEAEYHAANYNGDELIDILDVMMIIDLILSQ